MPNFEAKTLHGQYPVVSLSGECDLATCAELADALASALAGAVAEPPVVVVDLGGLVFIDSSGVHQLVMAHHAARERNGHVYVRNACGSVATVLELTGVGELLALPPDLAAVRPDVGR